MVTLTGLLIHNQHSLKCHMLVSPTSAKVFFFIAAGCRRVTLVVIKWYKFTLHQTFKEKRSTKNKNMSLVRLLL